MEDDIGINFNLLHESSMSMLLQAILRIESNRELLELVLLVLVRVYPIVVVVVVIISNFTIEK